MGARRAPLQFWDSRGGRYKPYNEHMCGIAGLYFFDQREVPQDCLRKMAAAISHRGPDQEGFYSAPGAGLASRRLKIIDLSDAAAQPMRDESTRYHLIYNGEIYNFRKLRVTLEKKYSFFSQSDTEVILRLFQEHRENAWPFLNGMFALAILDTKTKELFLARDHAGIKPLYYYQDSEKFLFGSEIKALLASGLIQPEVSTESLAFYLQLGYFPLEHSVYGQIRKLLPGEWIRADRAGVFRQRFWSIRSQSPAEDRKKDPADRLEALLKTSVERQMISDVPLGAFLSGGVDSSTIVALMAKVAPGNLKTFTVGFAPSMGYYDERPFAERIAKLFGTEHHEFVVDKRVDEIIPRLHSVFDEPFADSSAIPTLCLAELARKHVTVALSGTGGDEIFGGYRKYLAGRWAEAYTSLPGSVRSSIEKSTKLLPASRRSLWQERTLLLQRFSALTPEAQLNTQLNSIFTSSEISSLLGIDAPDFRPANGFDGTVAERMMLFDFEHYLPEDLLVKEDRCTMAFGLEARVPFLDREIVEYMFSLPFHYKVSRTSTKNLFKDVASRLLPDWVRKRPKHGFGSPVAEWLRSDLKSFAEDLLFSSSAFLKSPQIRQWYEQHQNESADHSKKLWALLMLELWHAERLMVK